MSPIKLKKYFIGIVPPDDIYQAVLHIQEQFGDNRLEPHITVRAPVNVANETAWLQAIENVCSSFSPVYIELPATGHFGNRVLFIAVKSERLGIMHDAMIQAIETFEQPDQNQQEHESFHPHLTLGRAWCGFTRQDFAAMKTMADEYLRNEPVAFVAKSVRIYHKPASEKRYEALKDVLLNANPAGKNEHELK